MTTGPWNILVVAPPWFVPDRSLEGLRAQNEVRTTLLQGLGGAALLVGAYVTHRQLQTSREGRSPSGSPARSTSSAASTWMCDWADSMRWSGSPVTRPPTGPRSGRC